MTRPCRMIRRRAGAIGVALAVAALVASGCGGSGGAASSASTPDSTSSAGGPSGTAADGYPAPDASTFDQVSAGIMPGVSLSEREARARSVCTSIAANGGDVVTWLKRTKAESSSLVDFEIQPLQLQNLAGLALRNYCREYLPALEQGLQGEIVSGQVGNGGSS